MTRLILTGAHGFVAGSVIAQAGESWEVHALSRGEPLVRREGLHWHRLDPLDPGSLARCFRTVRPEALIHPAAVADIDFCQANPAVARAVNVDFTRRLAELCDETGARMVFCSTDTVFDGEHAPYAEEDAPCPVNFYGETKAEAERTVGALGPRAVVARLALVLGLPVLGAGNSFLARLISLLRAGRQVAAPASEVRTPVDVLTAGRALLELAGGAHQGVFHLAGNEALNRLDLARRVAARLQLPPGPIGGGDPTRVPGRAPRPRDVSLRNGRARAALLTPMLDFDDTLDRILPGSARPTP
jgi:dTDP-4-dehydrorhamnose reductase